MGRHGRQSRFGNLIGVFLWMVLVSLPGLGCQDDLVLATDRESRALDGVQEEEDSESESDTGIAAAVGTTAAICGVGETQEWPRYEDWGLAGNMPLKDGGELFFNNPKGKLRRVGSDGVLRWQISVPGQIFDLWTRVVDDGFVLMYRDEKELSLMKLDNDGNTLWSTSLGQTFYSLEYEWLSDFQLELGSNGNIVVAYAMEPKAEDAPSDMGLASFGIENGALQWNEIYPETEADLTIWDVMIKEDGTTFVLGALTHHKFYVVKFDEQGQLIKKSRVIESPVTEMELFPVPSLRDGPDGGIYIVGGFSGDIVLKDELGSAILLTAPGGGDDGVWWPTYFMARYDAGLVLSWGRSIQSADDTGRAQYYGAPWIDKDWGIWLWGMIMDGDVVFGQGEEGATVLTGNSINVGAVKYFLARYTADGLLDWVHYLDPAVWPLQYGDGSFDFKICVDESYDLTLNDGTVQSLEPVDQRVCAPIELCDLP